MNANSKTAGEPHPPARLNPKLQVTLALEERPLVRLLCASAEDERRLVSWLLVTAELRDLGARILEAIEEAEQAA